MTDAPELLLERRGQVLVVRLNRPEARNALTPSMMAGIGAAVVEAENDPDTRALVLAGAGDRAFCSGMDLRGFSEGRSGATVDREAIGVFTRLVHGGVSLPVVGAANGAAVGGGFELLLGCDLIVASSAARFALPEVKRGLIPGGSGTFLGTRIPLGVALELVLTGEPIDARRAYELGLVNAVVEPDRVEEAAVGYAERIVANGPLAVAAVKELTRLAVADAAGAHERLAELQPEIFASADAKEGASAFVEKRQPIWQGK